MPPANEIPSHVLIFVPGYLGSKLIDESSGEEVWLDLRPARGMFARLKRDIERLKYPNPLKPAGVYEGWVFVPPLIKRHPHTHFRNWFLKQGYTMDWGASGRRNVFLEFAYDWRQDNRISAKQLAAFVDDVRSKFPGREIWLIAHSNGGLVTRWFIEKCGGNKLVNVQILLGAPWDGTPKAFRIAHSGLDFLPFSGTDFTVTPGWDRVFRPLLQMADFAKQTRDLTLTFPSIYQVFPHSNPYVVDEAGRQIDIFEGDRWLPHDAPPQALALLQDGMEFSRELANTLSVDTYCVFGNYCPTISVGIADILAGNRINTIDWRATSKGDGTIPLKSALYANAKERYPTRAVHGALCVDPNVHTYLSYVLRDRFDNMPRCAELPPPAYFVSLELGRDCYALGETIDIVARVSDAEGNPYPDVAVRMWITANELYAAEDTKGMRLAKMISPGVFQSSLTLPERSGIFQLVATATGAAQLTERISESILIVNSQEAGADIDLG